jgi:uncharacterized phage protein gp47/JayE
MPWTTPTLQQTRIVTKNYVLSQLGARAMIPNSALRIMSDGQAGLAHLTLLYIDWLAKQLLPDTAETVWLDRHGNIWLVNADGSTGRKGPTLAKGTITMTGTEGLIVPISTVVSNTSGVQYETTAQITIGLAETPVNVLALTAGTVGNMNAGDLLTVVSPPIGVNSAAIVVELGGGTDEETDDELRARVLLRIQEPPMGGDATDYEQWTLAVSGVTRAWCFPQEMGIGTCTVRFMMDDLRADNGGFPLPDDVDAVAAYLDTVRPVTVKDMFVEAPIPYPINVHIKYLSIDNAATHGAIIDSLQNQFMARSMPGQTWYRAWTDEGIMAASGVVAYDLVASDVVMPSNGYMPVLGDVTYG